MHVQKIGQRTMTENLTAVPAIVTFQFYYTPVLVATGTLGNFFAIYVFYRTKLRKLSSSYYLAALAVNDSVFLFSLLTVWLNMTGTDLFNRPGMCQTIVYVTGICSFLDIWFVAAFTFERYIAVKYPFLRHTLCTTQRARNTVLILTVISFVALSPLLLFSTTVTMDNNVTICSVNNQWRNFANIFNYVDFFATYILPVALVIFLNISICKALIHVSVVRKLLTNQKCEKKRFRTFKYQLTQNKVTKMLLIVSTTFLCLNLPSYITRIFAYLLEMGIVEIENIETFHWIQHWCLQLFYTSFGINFYLYCISGENFRRALIGIFSNDKNNGLDTLIVSDSRTTSNRSSSKKRRKTLSMKAMPKRNPQSTQQEINL